MSSPSQFIVPVDNELIAIADGVTRMWPLLVGGKPVRNVRGTPTIYQEDWQGRVELSDQPRTNYVTASAGTTAWTRSSVVTLTMTSVIADSGEAFVEAMINADGNPFVIAGHVSHVAHQGERYVGRLALRAGTVSYAKVAFYFSVYGESASYRVLRGPGIIDHPTSGQAFITGLSATEETVIEISADTPVGENLTPHWVVYPLEYGNTGAVGSSILITSAMVTDGDHSGAYIPTTDTPRTVTDYTYTAPTATVITPAPLPKGTKLYWSGELVFDVDPSLLPTSAVHGTKVVESAISSMANLAVPLRDLWNPTTCPLDLLPWLAWALSIDAWKSYWPESIKRERVARALDIQRHKGTVQSVQNVIASFGGAVQLREWWQQSPPGAPHTFDMILTLASATGAAATAQYVDDVIAEVTRTKPVRSHFTFTQGITAAAQIGVASVARPVAYRRMNFQAA